MRQRRKLFSQAETRVQEALALDDHFVYWLHAALASLKGLNGFDYPWAGIEYERTRQLNSDDATAHIMFGQ